MVNLSKNEEQLATELMSKINLSKDKINLEKHIVNLSKTVVNLSKENNIDIGDKKARVIVVLDYSGSMRKLYNDGTVQNTLTRLVPLGLTFDDNGAIEAYIFRNDSVKLTDITINNYSKYVDDFINNKVGKYGRTVYSPVLRSIYSTTKKKNKLFEIILKLLGKYNKTEENKLFIMFITDGNNENGDNTTCDNIISMLSHRDAFIKFIGIGDSDFRYFSRLPKIKDRKSNNTGYTIINNLNNIHDDELYNIVLKDFARWLKETEDI